MIRWISVATAVALTGCLPLRVEDAPHVEGRVVSERTQQPLRARVYYKGFPEEAVSTTDDGHFELEAVSRWHVVMIGTDRIPLATLVAEAPGHVPTEKAIYFGGPAFTQVLLKPEP